MMKPPGFGPHFILTKNLFKNKSKQNKKVLQIENHWIASVN
jgi:hypothetical protein